MDEWKLKYVLIPHLQNLIITGIISKNNLHNLQYSLEGLDQSLVGLANDVD